MRGKEASYYRDLDAYGITPAYAGKRPLPSSGGTRVRDHPRVCGEKKVSDIETAKQLGSPPRMRGKAGLYFISVRGDGITPAYAGKRRSDVSKRRHVEDHPRVCGEKLFFVISWNSCVGSPPRMRGKVTAEIEHKFRDGITPAYAGKSPRPLPQQPGVQDHPRVCGEKTKKIPSHRPFQLHPVPVSFSFA